MKFKDLDTPIEEGSHFKWKEVLFLPQWDIYAVPKNESIVVNIRKVVHVLDEIRNLFELPVLITSFYRPKPYNKLIGGAISSSHIQGMAADFIIPGKSSDEVRAVLKPKLKELNIRMEQGTPHVHIDINCYPEMEIEQRYFKP